MTCSVPRAIKKPACRNRSAAGALPLECLALAADESLHHCPSDVPLACARGYSQNPSRLLSQSGLQSTTAGARFGFLARVHRKKLTPSVVLSCLRNKVKKKRHLLKSFHIFRPPPAEIYFFFPDANSIFPGVIPRRLQSSAYSSR